MLYAMGFTCGLFAGSLITLIAVLYVAITQDDEDE